MYSIYDFVNIYMGNFKSTFRSTNLEVLIKFSYKILDIVCIKKKKNRKE